MAFSSLLSGAAAALPFSSSVDRRAGLGRLPKVSFPSHGRGGLLFGVASDVAKSVSFVRATSGSSPASDGGQEDERQLDFIKMKDLDAVYYYYMEEPPVNIPEDQEKLKGIAQRSIFLTVDTFNRLRFLPGAKPTPNSSIDDIYHTVLRALLSARFGRCRGDQVVRLVEGLDWLRREVSLACNAPLPRSAGRFFYHHDDAAREDSMVALVATAEMMFQVVESDVKAIMSAAA